MLRPSQQFPVTLNLQPISSRSFKETYKKIIKTNVEPHNESFHLKRATLSISTNQKPISNVDNSNTENEKQSYISKQLQKQQSKLSAGFLSTYWVARV